MRYPDNSITQHTKSEAQPMSEQTTPYDLTSQTNAIALIEAERRRLADMLQAHVIDAVNLLLHKCDCFGDMMREQGNTGGASSIDVLDSIGKDVLQRVRDVQQNLAPNDLEEHGLRLALMNLANRVERMANATILADIPPLQERFSPSLELAIYRVAQDVLTLLNGANRPRREIQLFLGLDEGQILFCISGPASVLAESMVRAVTWRAEVLGGQISIERENGDAILRITFPHDEGIDLTAREMDILVALGQGLSNKAIGDELGLSPHTVNFHLKNIYTKLGVNSRTEAVSYALRMGWIR
jgi:DNA-binding CsgD family transcriptional regulator